MDQSKKWKYNAELLRDYEANGTGMPVNALV